MKEITKNVLRLHDLYTVMLPALYSVYVLTASFNTVKTLSRTSQVKLMILNLGLWVRGFLEKNSMLYEFIFHL